jgi:hypothetical protein
MLGSLVLALTLLFSTSGGGSTSISPTSTVNYEYHQQGQLVGATGNN